MSALRWIFLIHVVPLRGLRSPPTDWYQPGQILGIMQNLDGESRKEWVDRS